MNLIKMAKFSVSVCQCTYCFTSTCYHCDDVKFCLIYFVGGIHVFFIQLLALDHISY